MPENQITYEGPNVAFFDVGTGGTSRSGENPGGGGETIVQGTYFEWEYPYVEGIKGGFTGTGWWGVEEYNSAYKSPTQAGGFQSEQEVADYLKNGSNNLNNAFAEWQAYINTLESWQQSLAVGDFGEAISKRGGAGCMSSI